jgi:tetratricopeptide (TPR) repeat protein
MVLGFCLMGASMMVQADAQALRASYAAEAKGDYQEALKSILDAASRDSRNYFLQMRVGYLNFMLAKYEKSLEAYQTAANLESNSVEALMGAVKAAAQLGRWNTVEQLAQEVLKKDASNYTALSRLAYAYFMRKDYAQASRYYQQVSDLYPSDTEMKNGLAWSSFYLGNVVKAKSLFSEVLAVNPEDANAKQGLAASSKSR